MPINEQWSRGINLGLGVDIVATALALPVRTSAELAAVGDLINTVGKAQGVVVYDSTLDNPVYAAGAAAGDIWVDGAGTTVHSPS